MAEFFFNVTGGIGENTGNNTGGNTGGNMGSTGDTSTPPATPTATPTGPLDSCGLTITGDAFDSLTGQAQQNLIPDFQCDLNMMKLVASYVRPLETIQCAIENANAKTELCDYKGRALDFIGALVGQTRNGQTDEFYKQSIEARILANTAQGDSDTLIELAQLALNYDDEVLFIDYYPTGFIIQITEDRLPPGANVAGAAVFINEARAAGVLGVFAYHTGTKAFRYGGPPGTGYGGGATYVTGVNV